jgi:hypothetical protein
MKGPISNESKISFWPGWLESVSVLFGLLVVAGLLTESGDEIWDFFVLRHAPLSKKLLGEFLVTVGVFGEVAMGVFIARSAKRQELKSAKEISAANERAAVAQQTAAEANLARVKIEERLAPRKLSEDAIADLVAVLSPYSGRRVDVVIYDAHVSEVLELGNSIDRAFSLAGWNNHVAWISGGFRVRDEAGLTLTVAQERTPAEEKDFECIAFELMPELSRYGIASSFFRGGFSKTEPLTVAASPEWKLNNVAVFRVQVGQKLL